MEGSQLEQEDMILAVHRFSFAVVAVYRWVSSVVQVHHSGDSSDYSVSSQVPAW
jgi:hypothetical protein